jgi:hypothetical protein
MMPVSPQMEKPGKRRKNELPWSFGDILCCSAKRINKLSLYDPLSTKNAITYQSVDLRQPLLWADLALGNLANDRNVLNIIIRARLHPYRIATYRNIPGFPLYTMQTGFKIFIHERNDFMTGKIENRHFYFFGARQGEFDSCG